MSTKKCPFCAEEIQQEAVLCKYCHSDLSKAKTTIPATPAISKTEINPSLQKTTLVAKQKKISKVENDVSQEKTQNSKIKKPLKITDYIGTGLFLAVLYGIFFYMANLPELNTPKSQMTNTPIITSTTAPTIAKSTPIPVKPTPTPTATPVVQSNFATFLDKWIEAGLITDGKAGTLYVSDLWYIMTVSEKEAFITMASTLFEESSGYRSIKINHYKSNELLGEFSVGFSGAYPKVYK